MMSSDGRGIPTLSILGGVSMGSRLPSLLYNIFCQGAKILWLPSHGYNKNGGYVKFWGARGDGSVRTGGI